VIRGGTAPVGAIVFTVFAALWMGTIGLITLVGWESIARQPAVKWILAAFWAAGLFLSAMAVRSILQVLRFPAGMLVLDSVPLPLGGWASGVVRAPLAVLGAEVQLGVECTRTTGSGGSNTTRSTTTLWRETKVLDGTRLSRGPDFVEIPFAIRLPSTVQPSAITIHPFGDDIDWYVKASARLPGVDWEEAFRVPVAAAPPGAVVDAQAPRAMPLLEGARLDAHLPGRFEVGSDADVLHFPVKPSFVLWPCGFGAVAAFLPLAHDVPALSGLPENVVFWGRVVAGIIALLSVVGLLLDPRRIEVRPDAVRIRRGLFGVGVHRTVLRQEVAAIEEKASTGNPPLYLVNIRTRDGKSYGVAPNIYQPDQAAALAARLRSILQVG
jgi:hypothetical protein